MVTRDMDNPGGSVIRAFVPVGFPWSGAEK
jgi:hypothetical protein